MEIRLRRISYAVAGLAIVLLFQNCAANQNFDLEQASKVAEASGGQSQGPEEGDLLPQTPAATPVATSTPAAVATPTLSPTPTPDPTDYSNQGAFCAVASGGNPKWQISIVDLAGENISAPSNLSSFFAGPRILTKMSFYKGELTQKAVNLSSGYHIGNGTVLKRSNNSLINSHFAMAMDSYLQLDSQLSGWYQLGVAASGLVELELGVGNAANKLLIQTLSGPNDIRFSCAKDKVYIRRGEQLPIRIRHLQGSNPNITLALYMRKISGTESLNPSYCGQVNPLFTPAEAATAEMSSILAAGWAPLSPANFVMIPDGPNLVNNGDFETVTGVTIPAGAFYLYRNNKSESLSSWTAYHNFELQGNGLNGLTPFRGGKFWIDLDAKGGQDAIWQAFDVESNSNYRYMFDYATPTSTAQTTAGVEVWRVDETANAFETIETVSAATGGQWMTYQTIVSSGSATKRMRVKLREVASQDDNLGAALDNIVYRKIRESNVMCGPGAPASKKLRILSASYGSETYFDATHFVRKKCEGEESCSFAVNNSMVGDPKVGAAKVLRLKMACPQGEVEVSFNENQTANLACP